MPPLHHSPACSRSMSCSPCFVRIFPARTSYISARHPGSTGSTSGIIPSSSRASSPIRHATEKALSHRHVSSVTGRQTLRRPQDSAEARTRSHAVTAEPWFATYVEPEFHRGTNSQNVSQMCRYHISYRPFETHLSQNSGIQNSGLRSRKKYLGTCATPTSMKRISAIRWSCSRP